MKIMFFALHSAIWPHAFPEALVAEALRDSGHEIVYVTCDRRLRAGCIAMTACGVASDASDASKDEVCRRCESHKGLLRSQFGFSGSDLGEVLTAEDLAETRHLVATVSRETLLDLEVLGVDVGRIALYEFLLNHKKSTLEFADDREWKSYLAGLENTLYATFAGKRLIERESPDAVVVYNALYSVNHAFCRLAGARGVAHYFLHSGGNLAHRLQSLMLSKGDIFNLMRGAIAAWPAYRDVPIDAATAHAVTDHFLELLKGRSGLAYSAPSTGETADLRINFGIGPGQKVLCATLSSYDERFAAEMVGARAPVAGLLFPTQADWIRALIDYASAHPDRFLIIRVHPREFPNKRDGVRSAHARELEAQLRDLPSNVAINWPDDRLSLYDLAEITDVFLNAWSSVGKEMTLLGIPVVLYSPDLPLYPVDLNYVGTTHTGYFEAIERAIADGWRRDNLVRTYRWCAVEYGRMLVDIADAYGASEYVPGSLLVRAKAKLVRLLDPYRQQRRDCSERPRPIRARAQIAGLFESGADTVLDARIGTPPPPAADEHAILDVEIGRLLRALHPKGAAAASRLGGLLLAGSMKQAA